MVTTQGSGPSNFPEVRLLSVRLVRLEEQLQASTMVQSVKGSVSGRLKRVLPDLE